MKASLYTTHVNFTNKKINYLPMVLNQKVIPHVNSTKYLGMTVDIKLHWKIHAKKKRTELYQKFSKLYWVLGRHSELSVYNKLMLYQQVLKPVWTYGVQLWDSQRKATENLSRFSK